MAAFVFVIWELIMKGGIWSNRWSSLNQTPLPLEWSWIMCQTVILFYIWV